MTGRTETVTGRPETRAQNEKPPGPRFGPVARVPGLLLAAIVFSLLLPSCAPGARINGRGRALSRVLDSMGVERYWQRGVPIDWKTGRIDAAGSPIESHCSAFVAAVATDLGIYILRPPDHPERLLANAQCRWLERDGADFGWRRINSPETAQALANRGELVVACYPNPDREEAGHIAIVRPSRKSMRRVDVEGPDIIQAGIENHQRTTVKEGFREHPSAWEEGRIRYFAHPWDPAEAGS